MVHRATTHSGGDILPDTSGLPPVQSGRLLKCWSGIALWCGDLALRAVRAQIGPLRQHFWVVADRATGRLWQSARSGSCSVLLSPGHLRLFGGEVGVDIALEPNGRGEPGGLHGPFTPAWTCWQDAVRVRGVIRLGTDRHRVEAVALRDDLVGYPGRRTTWRWSGGTGRDDSGQEVLWSAICGAGDGPARAAALIWRDGMVHDAGSARITEDRSSLELVGGEGLRCSAGMQFRWDDAFLTTHTSVRQSFGTFDGTLPLRIAVRGATGMIALHDLR